jgi:hypothetical protein
MGQADFFKLGDWNAICDMCGFKVKASKLRERWDGLMVCHKHETERHPQDFVRATEDKQTPPFTRPEAVDTFIDAGSVSAEDL